MTVSGYGPEIPAFATREQVESYVGPVRATELPEDEDEMTRLIQRASEVVYYASGNTATRAYEGLLLADPFGGYVDPLTIPRSLSQADYQFGLALAVGAQIEFWLEWGEDHGVVGLRGSAQSGQVMVSNLPSQLGPRAKIHLSSMGLLGTKASIR